MTITVKSITKQETRPRKTGDGTYTITKFIAGDGREIGTFDAVEAGQSYEGTITDKGYGPTFQKTSAPRVSEKVFKADPEKQQSIEWQSARNAALDYIIAKANLYKELGDPDKALEELTRKHWAIVTLHAKRLAEGKLELNKQEDDGLMDSLAEDADKETSGGHNEDE